MIGIGKYKGETTVITEQAGDKYLIVVSTNPIDMRWVPYTEVYNIRWNISQAEPIDANFLGEINNA